MVRFVAGFVVLCAENDENLCLIESIGMLTVQRVSRYVTRAP